LPLIYSPLVINLACLLLGSFDRFLKMRFVRGADVNLYPPEDFKNAPRRYFVDGKGRRVLVGLTFEETFEFEALDGLPVSDVDTRHDEVRWRELYGKHDEAWKNWMTKASLDRQESRQEDLLRLN
jgi:hypothetical protein